MYHICICRKYFTSRNLVPDRTCLLIETSQQGRVAPKKKDIFDAEIWGVPDEAWAPAGWCAMHIAGWQPQKKRALVFPPPGCMKCWKAFKNCKSLNRACILCIDRQFMLLSMRPSTNDGRSSLSSQPIRPTHESALAALAVQDLQVLLWFPKNWSDLRYWAVGLPNIKKNERNKNWLPKRIFQRIFLASYNHLQYFEIIYGYPGHRTEGSIDQVQGIIGSDLRRWQVVFLVPYHHHAKPAVAAPSPSSRWLGVRWGYQHPVWFASTFDIGYNMT